MASEVTSSINLELDLGLDLKDVLSLAGIELPTLPSGSFNFPKKIKFEQIKGIVVDVITNEPLPGVKVTNSLLKKSTTNKNGEFSIKHPAIGGTGLNPSKFKLNFKKKEYSPTTTIPYTSTGDIKPNIGIITLKSKESNLKKEILSLLRFPPSTVEDYATKNITIDFTIQKQLNVSISDLKAIVIPLILGLIAAYGISEIQKIIDKAKINPKAAFDEIKDIITCPSKEKVDKLIITKNKLVKKLSNTLKIIEKTTKTLTQTEKIIGITSTTVKILRQLPTPVAVGGVGIPQNVIIKVQDTLKKLDILVEKLLYINTTTLMILTLLQAVLTQVLSFLNLLDLLIKFCYENSDKNPDDSLNQISSKLTLLTTQESNQKSPIVTDVNGFTIGVETESQISTLSIKRRRATATNKQGVVMLTGEWSFSSIDQILIDELVFYIQQNDLKAD